MIIRNCFRFSSFQVRELRFNSQRRLGLDEMLLVFGQSGVVSYNVFTIIAGYYVMDAGKDDESMLVLMAALAALFQVPASIQEHIHIHEKFNKNSIKIRPMVKA